MNKYICIHAHFYQPPRENPWLEEVELQDSAYPFHDWNERITGEAYAPNTLSRILDTENRVINIVNNYPYISFDFGPTLLSWMERHKPDIYKNIIQSDMESRANFSGHGSAMAIAHNHMIMPLANARDKRTQVIWGIKDFEYRFKRKPEGMWLPETAVDYETLDLLCEYGIKFTILSPTQVARVRPVGETKWKEVIDGNIDPKIPYLCTLPSGRSIALFLYDAPVSHDIAFGGLLNNGEYLAQRLINLLSPDLDIPQIVHIATDGETYGHHHHYGEMALSYCLNSIATKPSVKLTVYGEFLEKYPPEHEIEIHEYSSWSCVHGVERWRRNCGCNSGMKIGWQQEWRKPLREALDWLRDNLSPIYEQHISRFMRNPWSVRNSYIDVIIDRSVATTNNFFSRHAFKDLLSDDKTTILKLCEMQRHAQLMYTSCGWFFDEISGIETVQIIQYAARAIQLAKEVSGIDLEEGFIEKLSQAPTNIPEFKHGGHVYELFVKPTVLDLLRVGAHYAISSLFKDYPEKSSIYCYSITSQSHDHLESGKQKISFGKGIIKSNITWEEIMMSYTALHMGDHNVIGGVSEYKGNENFVAMTNKVKEAFSKSDISEIMFLIDSYYGSRHYTIWHLLKDEQRMIVDKILESTLSEIETLFRHINENHYSSMKLLKEMRMPLPKALSTTFEFILNKDLKRTIEHDPIDYERLKKLVHEVTHWYFDIDRTIVGFVASRKINMLMSLFGQKPDDTSPLTTLDMLLDAIKPLHLNLNIWEAQNTYFSLAKKLYPLIHKKDHDDEPPVIEWINLFENIGHHLNVRTY